MFLRKTLILSRKDVAKLLDVQRAIGAVEEAFAQYGLGRARMPPKIYLDLPEFAGDFRAMPSYVRKFKLCTLKWVNAHPRNARFGLPAVMAVLIVSDPKTGFPLAIMDGTLATSLRTGAGGAVAAKYLARRNSSVAALVGCGVQARSQLAALREIFKIKEVRVWGHQKALAARFIRTMRKPGEVMTAAARIQGCVTGADIVVTTTPSRKPIIRSQWIKDGTHINAIGADAPGKEELDPEIFKRARVVVDDVEQASHSGEINVPVAKGIFKPENIYATLGEVVAGKKKGRNSPHAVTVFDSTGLAIQDTAVASLIYKAALKENIGRWMTIV
ncbi:MAG TPA: alanine dehydrogenase [Candidatus Omnitrophica bacterium]|nr:alanine dehydrogenase [Candidatus Omnitrophota bacterium]HCI45007.1 alanine dehydrogenase [Candidatus Omnitrophota bacterium]